MTDIERVRSATVVESSGQAWSNCLRVPPFVFLSGLTAGAGDGSIVGSDLEGQTREIFRKMGGLLEAAGSHLGDVVKLVIYLTDIADRSGFSAVRSEVFDSEVPPCSTLVEVSGLVDDRLFVEVDATAVIPTTG